MSVDGGSGWDPQRYLGFAEHRARPFHDLLGRVGAAAPRAVVDAGCGPGHLTAELARRWPGARVTGFDASPEMVAQARDRGVAVTLDDAATWAPSGDVDVVVCNAVLHWVPDHLGVLRRWAAALPDGGWVAVQLPGNAVAPSHALVAELTEEPRWRGRLSGVLGGSGTTAQPAAYAAALADAGCEPDVWVTTYEHRLAGPDPVLAWLTSTTLRPVRAALDDAGWAGFTAELAPRLRAAHPRDGRGVTVMPFRRVFAVGHRTGAAAAPEG
ncbi:trans-aconitate 2-methyltransferase [Rhodococcus aerolatus]